MSVTDNFDRANSGSLGANWTNNSGGGPQVTSNKARGTTAGVYNGAYYSGSSWNSDHSSQVTLSNATAGTIEQSGPTVRCSAGGHYYWLFCEEGAAVARIYRYDGSFTSLQTINSISWADGDTAKLEVTGTGGSQVLRAYRNGGQIGSDQPDSALSGGSPGFNLFSELSVGNAADDWQGTGEAVADAVPVCWGQYRRRRAG